MSGAKAGPASSLVNATTKTGTSGHGEMFEIKFGDAVAGKPPPRLTSVSRKDCSGVCSSKQNSRGLLGLMGRQSRQVEHKTADDSKARVVGASSGVRLVRKKSLSLKQRIESRRRKSKGKKDL